MNLDSSDCALIVLDTQVLTLTTSTQGQLEVGTYRLSLNPSDVVELSFVGDCALCGGFKFTTVYLSKRW